MNIVAMNKSKGSSYL